MVRYKFSALSVSQQLLFFEDILYLPIGFIYKLGEFRFAKHYFYVFVGGLLLPSELMEVAGLFWRQILVIIVMKSIEDVRSSHLCLTILLSRVQVG